MIKVRHIVEPYLDDLADESVRGDRRKEAFDELSLELKEFDYPSTRDDDDEEEEEDDDEGWEDVPSSDERDQFREIQREQAAELEREFNRDMEREYAAEIEREFRQEEDEESF
jgi:hypothetical protein